MEKIKIVCFMGKSGSGKTTLINKIAERLEDTQVVKSFSTREPRNEEDKTSHTFVEMKDYNSSKRKKELLLDYYDEVKDYHNYVTEKSFDENKVNLFAIDPIAYKELVELEKYSVLGVYISISDNIRLDRLNKRDGITELPEEKHLEYVEPEKSHNTISVSIYENDYNEDELISLIINSIKLIE